MEEWKDVEGYEGLYVVSSLGRIKSVTRYKKILKPWIDKDGYNTVSLAKEGKEKTIRVCRIVAKAFVQNNENKPQVNHIDMNRGNDCADNLEWVTCKENVYHSLKHGKYKGSNHKKVLQCKDGKVIAYFNSESEAARQLNIKVSNICKCIKGYDRKRAGGYEWKLAMED